MKATTTEDVKDLPTKTLDYTKTTINNKVDSAKTTLNSKVSTINGKVNTLVEPINDRIEKVIDTYLPSSTTISKDSTSTGVERTINISKNAYSRTNSLVSVKLNEYKNLALTKKNELNDQKNNLVANGKKLPSEIVGKVNGTVSAGLAKFKSDEKVIVNGVTNGSDVKID